MTTTPIVDLSWGRSFVHGFPHDFFTWLRREHPVWWHGPTEHTPGGEGFWVISRHADAVAVMRDPVTYSSGQGGTAIDDSPGGVLLNQTDDPQHLRLRQLVNRGFTPRSIVRLEDDLRQRARHILDQVTPGEPFDFVALVAQELPLQAICSILGVPLADRGLLADIVNGAIEAGTGEVLGAEHVKALAAYGGDLIVAKRRNPGDDILSSIVQARGPDLEPLSDRELKAFFTLLFPAGAETTRSALAGTLLAFADHPDQEARLRSDPAGLMRSAVEEIVRWTSPSVYKRRTVTAATELAGQRFEPGHKVTYWEMSANRDETVFTDPFRFDVGRDPNPHVGFGHGAHFCLGASLARTEIRVMLSEMLARFGRFELTGEPVWVPNNRLVGVIRLPVVFHLA